MVALHRSLALIVFLLSTYFGYAQTEKLTPIPPPRGVLEKTSGVVLTGLGGIFILGGLFFTGEEGIILGGSVMTAGGIFLLERGREKNEKYHKWRQQYTQLDKRTDPEWRLAERHGIGIGTSPFKVHW